MFKFPMAKRILIIQVSQSVLLLLLVGVFTEVLLEVFPEFIRQFWAASEALCYHGEAWLPVQSQ